MGRPKGSPNKATTEIRAAAKRLLKDKDYRAALKKRLIAGTAGAVEVALYHYAYGKPKESVSLENPDGSAMGFTVKFNAE